MKDAVGRLQLQREIIFIADDALITITVRGGRSHHGFGGVSRRRIGNGRFNFSSRMSLTVITEIWSDESAAAGSHMAGGALGVAKEKRFAIFWIAGQWCGFGLSLQLFYVGHQRRDCSFSQSLERRHSRSGHPTGNDGEQLTRRKLLHLRVSDDVRRSFAARSIQSMAGRAGGCEKLPGILTLRRMRTRVLLVLLRHSEQRNKKDQQTSCPPNRLACNHPELHFRAVPQFPIIAQPAENVNHSLHIDRRLTKITSILGCNSVLKRVNTG